MYVQKKTKPKSSSSRSSESVIRPVATYNPVNKSTSEANSNRSTGSNSSIIGPESFQPFKNIQTKSKSSGNTPPIQKKETGKSQNSPKNETGMSDTLKSGLENLSGKNLSGIRVHYNSSKPETIQAHAYTQGQDIHVAPGQEKFLPHEGWHVVQQMQGRVQPTVQKKNALINDDSSLEKEADVMGEKALNLNSTHTNVKTESSGTPTHNGVIQGAMKFEWQISGNTLHRDTGKEVQVLPRKYGPEDYIVKGTSGVRYETDQGGDSEFETDWEKKWPKLEAQVTEAQQMADQVNNAPDVTASDGKTYKSLPFTAQQLAHLGPGQNFSKTGTKWDKNQNTGKILVSAEKENVRSSPEYNSSDPLANKIGEVTKGTKLTVISTSSDGKWIQFKSDSVDGWIWKASTQPETKRYESNYITLNGKHQYTDTELKSTEKLLVKLDDPTWFAGFQVSESFELEQFGSYLKGNHKSAEPIVSGHVSDLMALSTASGASNGLKNFLLMVIYFIQRARSVDLRDNGDVFYAKAAFQLMSRTNFGSIYKSSNLTDQDRTIFSSLVKDTKDGILPELGLDKTSKVFIHGQGAGNTEQHNPTVYSWLTGITQNKDVLSGPTGLVSGAMGKFDINKEEGINKNLVRFENRGPDNRGQIVDDWLDYTRLHFEAAMTERPRTTGKGKTGLEK